MEISETFNYRWNTKDYPEKNGRKVYSCFSCGGGSTMGYKLAGYEVIGANDIDPKMRDVYLLNNNPKYYHLCPVGDLTKSDDFPVELYDIDILDGSPPCSTFSVSGLREKAWGEKKKFREGQAEQVLDELFFDWVKLVNKIQPKVAIAENVKGMLMGGARQYVKRIFLELEKAGYDTQVFLVNGAEWGLPQRRQRVFFIARRKDMNFPKLDLTKIPKQRPCVFSKIDDGIVEGAKEMSDNLRSYWNETLPGENFSKAHVNGSFFNYSKTHPNRVPPTLTATGGIHHHEQPRTLTVNEMKLISSFPLDYDFGKSDPCYIMGMSVPPIMVANIANLIYKVWFSNGK